MVAALEFDYALAAGKTACKADSDHRSFGTRADHAYFLHRRHQFADLLREQSFYFGGRAEAQALPYARGDRLDDVRMRMSGDHRPPATDVIDVRTPIGVEQVSALGALDERWRAADRIEGTYWRVDATGHRRKRSLEQCFRFRRHFLDP